MCVWQSAHVWHSVWVDAHVSLSKKKRKEKKKVPVILVCGSPQLTLSSGWGSSHTPPHPGTRREGRASERDSAWAQERDAAKRVSKTCKWRRGEEDDGEEEGGGGRSRLIQKVWEISGNVPWVRVRRRVTSEKNNGNKKQANNEQKTTQEKSFNIWQNRTSLVKLLLGKTKNNTES